MFLRIGNFFDHPFPVLILLHFLPTLPHPHCFTVNGLCVLFIKWKLVCPPKSAANLLQSTFHSHTPDNILEQNIIFFCYSEPKFCFIFKAVFATLLLIPPMAAEYIKKLCGQTQIGIVWKVNKRPLR